MEALTLVSMIVAVAAAPFDVAVVAVVEDSPMLVDKDLSAGKADSLPYRNKKPVFG